MNLHPERMSEPEVSLRLAMYLLARGMTHETVEVFVDGAHVQTAGEVHFPLQAFMSHMGWRGFEAYAWQTVYSNPAMPATIKVHSNLGLGDVSARLKDGRAFIAQAKKGPLANGRSTEYGLLRGAIGQLMTMEDDLGDACLAVAVPASPKFNELAQRWRAAPLVRRAGLKILTVERSGEVFGW